MELPPLLITSLRARPVHVPMARALQTSGGLVEGAPFVLIDLITDQGVVGRSYVFCYTAIALKPLVELLRNLATMIAREPLSAFNVERKLRQTFRLLGSQGFTGIALAGIDMAVWDAMARTVELPLVRLLGGQPRSIQAYNSCGLGIIGPERAGKEAEELAAPGFTAIKIRLGYSTIEADLAVIRAARAAIGNAILLMSDYNQCLSVPEAKHRTRRLDDEGLAWIEEPTTAEDFAGHAEIRRVSRTPIQIGENWWGVTDMTKSLREGASDLVMLDAMKIGGVTGWLRAAALAESQALPASSHLFPEFSAHLLAVTPTAHWLEYVDWANPILEEPYVCEHGKVVIPDRPGAGLSWNERAVERYAYD